MPKALLPFALLAQIAATTAAQAGETVVYTYDAKGRLVKVERIGTVNNGVTTAYAYDKADNRTQVKVTGSTH
jgi:YD repeat-containing protein